MKYAKYVRKISMEIRENIRTHPSMYYVICPRKEKCASRLLYKSYFLYAQIRLLYNMKTVIIILRFFHGSLLAVLDHLQCSSQLGPRKRDTMNLLFGKSYQMAVSGRRPIELLLIEQSRAIALSEGCYLVPHPRLLVKGPDRCLMKAHPACQDEFLDCWTR